jgi:hypothetical protein
VHFAITKADAERLLAASTDDVVVRIVQDEIEERWEEDWLYQTDKAWDAIHRRLTDGTLDINGGSYPLRLAVLGGRQLHRGDDYIVSLVEPSEAYNVARELVKIERPWMRSRYDSIAAEWRGLVDPELDWEYTWDYFSGLGSFFQKAAEAGRFVLFSVDQ